ncbi:MAG: hypothetical protein KBA85_09570 [Chloroflexi bacterium]|nr:hypothetical protein [Chloroflexota bacterium]MBP7591841.1 hypothetical protein [Chloroflexota bacterium]
MFLHSATIFHLAQQVEETNSAWWWLLIIGLIALILFFYWWRQKSQKDLAEVVAFEKQHPLGLAMEEGFVPAAKTAVTPPAHNTHAESAHAKPAHAESAYAAPEHEEPVGETAVPETITPDDLKLIEGIGPKIAELLNAANILTFTQLAHADTAHLNQILEAAGPRYQLADPTSWPPQAALAAAADWDGFKALQDSLKGGRQAE